MARERGIYAKALVERMARHGSLKKTAGISRAMKRIFVTAFDVKPEDHLSVQAAFQNPNIPEDALQDCALFDICDFIWKWYNVTENLHWLGHATFRWDGSKTVYFDPWNVPPGSKKAGIILVTHEHFDHFSKPDIARISDEETVVVAGEAVASQLKEQKEHVKAIKTVSPGDDIELSGVRIKAIASYNIGKSYHTKASKKIGFVVTMDGVSVYHAGDTDNIPELKDVRCDIALLPVGGTYTMTAEEAAAAALTIRPKAAIPMHYGEIVGTPGDSKRFEELLNGKVEVRILKKEGNVIGGHDEGES